jgi:hypothetical protein
MQWLTPIILALWEGELGRIQGQPGEKKLVRFHFNKQVKYGGASQLCGRHK